MPLAGFGMNPQALVHMLEVAHSRAVAMGRTAAAHR